MLSSPQAELPRKRLMMLEIPDWINIMGFMLELTVPNAAVRENDSSGGEPVRPELLIKNVLPSTKRARKRKSGS